MAGDTQSTSLGDLCDAKRGITYGIVKVGEFVPGGVPVIRGGDIRDGRIAFNDEKRVTEEVSQQFQRTILKGGEIVINLIAEPGHTAIVPPDLAGANVSRDVAVIPLDDTVDHRYVDYCLKSPMAVQWLTSRLQGSVTQKINLATLRDLPIPLPSLNEQRAIANILGTLDDKIELNRRMNGTLEGIARAIFKSWFEDFDPVRAKVEGLQPSGVDAETVRLFPSSFEESTPGVLPSGWRWGSIADIAAYVNGRNFTKDATGYGRMVIRIAELNSGPGSSTVFNDVEAEQANIAQPDDILFAWSGSLGVYRWHRDEALINQHIFKVICNEFPRWFVFYQLEGSMDHFREIASHKATTMGHIKRGHLAEVAVPLPPKELLTSASRIISPTYRRIHVLERESQTLSDLRDALIPKLISGEIRIRDAEQMAEVAVG
jgi:type I restriction enzyme S subunit